jgi:hypothetical protein
MTESASNEAQIVLADAQFGVVRIMRPYSGFEEVYQGTPAGEPIYLFPGGKNIDPIAEQDTPGYDPLLARGLPVPVGARLLLDIPNVYFTTHAEPVGYVYALIWRKRNVFDFRQLRNPFHFPRDQGADDTTAPIGRQRRVPLPASYNTITYIQTEPVVPLDRAVSNIRSEDLRAGTTPLALPKLSGGRTQPIQQGILNPSTVADANQPGFTAHEVQALGDEVIIAVYRPTGVLEDNWDFGNGETDFRFSQFYGTGTGEELPNIGVHVMPGTAP